MNMSHYHLTFLDGMQWERGRRSPTAGPPVEQCIGLTTVQHQNALERIGMAQANVIAADRHLSQTSAA